jgi:hypothetical protein
VTHHPVVLTSERGEVAGCALAAERLFTAPVVDLRLRVWLRVVLRRPLRDLLVSSYPDEVAGVVAEALVGAVRVGALNRTRR